MTNNYRISGLTCNGCITKVTQLLKNIEGVNSVKINDVKEVAIIDSTKGISIHILKAALAAHPKYEINEQLITDETVTLVESQKQSWLKTYKPILLIFGYLIGVITLVQLKNGEFKLVEAMRYFMAGFFFVFSFFKLLTIKGFAESYKMYDIVAKYLPVWTYIYPFVELGLAIAFLIDFMPIVTNIIMLLVMSVSIVGVLHSVLNKKKIQCACLGAVFNLPMSTVTIIEDGLMIVMSLAMLYLMK